MARKIRKVAKDTRELFNVLIFKEMTKNLAKLQL